MLVTDHFRIVARREHPIHEREDLRLERLLEYSWVLPWASPTLSPVLRQRLEQIFLQRDLPIPIPVLETHYVSLCMTALQTDDYLGFITELQLERSASTSLVPILLPGVGTERRAGIVTRRGVALNPSVRTFIHELRRV